MPEKARGSKLLWQKRLRGAGLTPVEYMVLLTVSTYADENLQHAHPGWARLVTDTGLDERTIKRAASRLAQKGFLMLTTAGGNQYGKGIANEYALTLPSIHKGGTGGTPSDENDDTEGGHAVQARGASGAPEGGHPVYPHQVPTSDQHIRSSSSLSSVTRTRARSA